MPQEKAVVENVAAEERVEAQMSPIDGSWGQEMYGVKNQKMSRGEFYESMKKRLDWQIAGDKLDGWQLERYKDEAYGHYTNSHL